MPRVAYLINQYPKVSHTFVRREIEALERAGTAVDRFAVRGWDERPIDPEDQREQSRTRYLLQGGPWPLLRAAIAVAARRPMRTLRAIVACLELGRRADRPLPLHLVYLLEACRLLRWLEASEVGHLHAHFGTNAAMVALLCRRLGGPPYSFTVHGPEEFDRPRALRLREKAADAAFVVAISDYGRSQLMRWVDPSDWGKLTVVRCGLDASYATGSDGSTTRAGQRFVCVGRLCEQKGQLLLVDAAARLRELGLHFSIVLAGDGEMRPAIERAIERHRLGDSIRITGWLTAAQVRDEIAQARALVLPSFAEGLPVVLMEAFALGRPVITTWIAGIPELVRDGESGWLVPAGSVDALVAAIRACLEAPNERLATMGATGRARVLERHDVDASAARILAAISTGVPA